MKKTKTLSSLVASLCLCAALTGCAGSSEETPVNSDSVSYTTADVQSLLDEAEDSAETTVPDGQDETYSAASFATATDVENEADRAIYKTSLTLPEGWQIVEDSDQGKIYMGNNAQLKIQAVNYGKDAELTDLDEFADTVAANIVVNNVYLKADTEFGDPVHTTVAGNDAVRYDYVVSAYFFETDDEGNTVGDKQLYDTYPGRIYVFYNDTDGYFLQFESDSKNIDEANKDFDAIIESFAILDDGTEGYESASVYMSLQEEYSISAEESSFMSQVEADLEAESRSKASEEAASETSE